MFEVSIIMPVYNVKDYLPRAIDSALNQKEVFAEIILVDDESTDGSAEICDDYAEAEPLLIRVIHQKNQGAGPARNAGLKEAKGKYVYFADPDDYFEPRLLRDNLKLIKDNPADMVVFGYTQELAGQPNDRQIKLPNLPQMPTQEEFRTHFRNFYHFSPYALWNKLYKRSFLKKNGIRFTDQPVGEDALFNIAVLKQIESLAVNRREYYHYVSHNQSAVNRYRPNRLEMELKVAQSFEDLLHHWNLVDDFKDLLAEEYFNVIYLETANLDYEECSLKEAEKAERLQQLWQEIETFITNHKTDERNPFRNALLSDFKRKKFNNALKLMQARNKAAKNYGKAFNRIKQFFKS